MKTNKIKLKIFLITLVFCGAFLVFFASGAKAAVNTGTFTSQVKDLSFQVNFGTISWSESNPVGTYITMEARAGNNADASDGVWTAVNNGGSLDVDFDGRRYVQYRATLSSDDINLVPILSDVTVSAFMGVLTSSPYNSSSAGDVLNAISWTQNVVGTSKIVFQVRSSVDNRSWSPWCGPDNGAVGCNSLTWFDDSSGAQTIDADLKDGVNDMWFQWRAMLIADYNDATFPTLSSVHVDYETAIYAGTITSAIKDLSGPVNFGTITWSATTTAQNALSMRVRAGNNPDLSDGVWTSFNSGDSLGIFSGKQYVQYQATLSTWDVSDSPLLNDVNIAYTNFPVGAHKILSSPYDTRDAYNLLAKIQWAENVSANTEVKFQMRSAPDNAGAPNWANGSGWCGPVNCSATKADGDFATDFYQTSPTGEDANPIHKAGGNDQWIQYVVWLETTSSAFAPTISETTLTYVVNSTPQVQDTVSVQGTDGKVTTTFNVKDSDSSTGATNGTVLGGLQYCTANCGTPGGETWANAATVTYKNGAGNTLPNNILNIEEINYTPYSIIWTPKTDYPENYNANFKIRVTANDSEAANNIGYGISNAFTLDTKNPIIPTFTIDHTKNELTINSPVDNSPYEVYIGNTPSTLFEIANKTNPILNQGSIYPKTYTYLNMTQDPATVYVGIKDEKSNTAYSQTTTPAKPSSVVYYDTSNSATNEFREFIAWDVLSALQVGAGFASYKVYRSIDNVNFILVGTINNRETNYLLQTDLTQIKYYYKLLVEDINGNKSAFSSTVDDTPDGQGGTDQTPPTISNVKVTNINTTSATVTWTTDELSDSSVGYSEGTTYLPERGLASMTLSHEIVLTGLNPYTIYNIRVKSRDLIGNLGQNDKDNNGASLIPDFTFATLPGPSISSVTIPNVSNTQATIDWKTDTDSSSFVVYSDTVSNGTLINPKEFGTPDLSGNLTNGKYAHSQTITTYNDQPLIPNKVYYFYVKSVDAEDNISTDNNGGNFYELRTTEDSSAPIISDITTPIISHNSVAINWITDEPATSKVSYKKQSANDYSNSEEVLIYDRSHYIILSDLEPDTKYDFKVTSKDINTNSKTSDPQEFTTAKNLEFQHDPLSTITFNETNPSILTDIVSVISFTTDQNANCFVEYGTESKNLSAVPAQEGKDIFNKGHNIQLNGLIFLTPYFYKVTCQDNLETVVSSNEKEFITKEQYFTAAGAGALLDKTPPVINNVKVASVDGESAVITWETDENASSTVGYGIATSNESGATDQLVNNNISKYTTSHLVVITGLIPATKYLFKATSLDASGNIAESAESSFTTASPSSLTSIKAQSLNLGEATITWSTSSETSSTVEYGLTSSYGEKKESSTLTKDHTIQLSSLNQGTTYHYRVKGKDENGKLYASSDQTFEPKSPPKIENISINDITEHEAKVTFTTNVPTTATVNFTNISDPQDNGSQSDTEMATKHTIQLKNLTQGTTFKIQINARDEQVTQSTIEAKDITTGKDENPPKIDMVKTDLALTQNDKVQAIISWKTDEQATTTVTYKEGRNGDTKEFKVSDNMTTNHIAVITSFKPGIVYYFNARSTDASGNKGSSTDFALLTPKKRQNIIQIIIGNFTDIFGWARM